MAAYKKKTKEEIQQEVDQLSKTMDDSIEKFYRSPEELQEYLSFMSKFHKYSVGNVSLLQNQFEGAQAVGSFKFWKEQGYAVNKGEKGLKIFVPTVVKAKFQSTDGTWKLLKEATAQEKRLIEENKLKNVPDRMGFKIGHVFDVSQTNCPESDLPKIFPNKWMEGEIQNYAGFMDALQDVADSIDVKIVPAQHELGASKGAYYPMDHVISLNPRNGELQNATTLIHELAHAKLHNKDKYYNTTRNEQEFQAEMVSYTVSSYFGLDNNDGSKAEKSLSYLANWTKGKELKDKKKLLDEIRETSNEFISTIENSFTKEMNIEMDFGVDQKIVFDKKEYEQLVSDNQVEMDFGVDQKIVFDKKEYEQLVSDNQEASIYWYEMDKRPIGIGCQPKGFIDTQDDKGRHGLVAYSHELTEKELDEYEMKKWASNVYLIDMTDTFNQSFEAMPLNRLKEKQVHGESYKGTDDALYIKSFNEANKERYFIMSEDQLKEPMVLIKWSEHSRLNSSEIMPLTIANPLFAELNKESEQYVGYYKTRYSVLIPHEEKGMQLISPDRHDLGDGYSVDILQQLKEERLLQPEQVKMLSNTLNHEKELEFSK